MLVLFLVSRTWWHRQLKMMQLVLIWKTGFACTWTNRGEDSYYWSESDVKARSSYINLPFLFIMCRPVNKCQYKFIIHRIFMKCYLSLSVFILLKQVTASGRWVALHPPLVFNIMCCAQGHQHHLREHLPTMSTDKMRFSVLFGVKIRF